MEAANTLVKDYSKISDNMISYSNSLTATSVVLEAINDFLTALSSIDGLTHYTKQFTKFEDRTFLENAVRYILTFRSTTSLVITSTIFMSFIDPQNRNLFVFV